MTGTYLNNDWDNGEEDAIAPWLMPCDESYLEEKSTKKGFLNEFFNGTLTRKKLFLSSCVPLAIWGGVISLQYIDKYTGGDVVMNVVDAGVESAVETYHAFPEDWADKEKLQALLEHMSGFSEVASALRLDTTKLAALNQIVMATISNYPDDDTKIRNAALQFQIANYERFAVAYGFRAQVLARTHPDMPVEEREQILAAELVNDIISSCENVRSLENHPVTKQTVGSFLKENPDLLDKLPEGFQNGLKQVFPELDPEYQVQPENITTEFLIVGEPIIMDQWPAEYQQGPIEFFEVEGDDYDGLGEVFQEDTYGFDRQQGDSRGAVPAPFADHAPSSLQENVREKMVRPSRDLRRAATARAEGLRDRVADAVPKKPTVLERLQCAPQYWYGKSAVAKCLLEASRN